MPALMQRSESAKLGGNVGAYGYGLGTGWLCERTRLVVFVF